MVDIPTFEHPLRLPADTRQGIGAAVKHALSCAPSLTDFVIHEGEPIRVKSARGTLPLHQVFPSIPPFLVSREHIVAYLAGYVDGAARQHKADSGQPISAHDHWASRIQPVLARQAALHFRLDGRGSHSLRCSLCLHGAGTLALVMRIIPTDITPLAELGLHPRLLSTLVESTSGLVVITGPSGSGKSDTAMSLLDAHNARQAGHIVTVEDPIERKLLPRRCIVTRREVGQDVASIAEGLHDALRMSPDVVLTSEIPDADAAERAILAGDTGTLMVATTRGRSVTGTLRRILGQTGARADALRPVLAGNLVAVVRQALVPARDGRRYLMAADVLFNVGAVTPFIDRGDWTGLDGALREGKLGGSEWRSMNERLAEFVRYDEIDAIEALRATSDIPALRRQLIGLAAFPGMR